MLTEHTKHVIDGISVGTVVSTLMGLLPHIAAFFTIIWTIIRIIETETCKRCFAWFRNKK